MTSRKGGYIIIDLTSTTLVDDLAIALESNKPVLVYNADDEANYFTLSYDSVSETYTLTGAKNTYTVDDDGVITPVVPESNKLYRHYISYQPKTSDIQMFLIEVLSKKSTALTFAEVLTSAYSVCGTGVVDAELYPANINIYDGAITVDFIYLNSGTATKATDSFDSADDFEVINDTIVEI